MMIAKSTFCSRVKNLKFRRNLENFHSCGQHFYKTRMSRVQKMVTSRMIVKTFLWHEFRQKTTRRLNTNKKIWIPSSHKPSLNLDLVFRIWGLSSYLVCSMNGGCFLSSLCSLMISNPDSCWIHNIRNGFGICQWLEWDPYFYRQGSHISHGLQLGIQQQVHRKSG